MSISKFKPIARLPQSKKMYLDATIRKIQLRGAEIRQ
jgi:hypothetical protein